MLYLIANVREPKLAYRHRTGRGAALAGRAWNCCVQTCCLRTPTEDRPRSASTISPPSEHAQIYSVR